MSRFNAKALGAASVLALAGTAFGQLTVQEPVIDNREFVGDTTRILFDAAGVGGETITGITAQFFVVRDNGNVNPVGSPRTVPATAVYDDATDFTIPGTFFALAGGNDDVIIDMGRLLGSSADLVMDRDAALASIGNADGVDGAINQTIYLEFSLTTDGPSTITTITPSNPGNAPEAASAVNGGIEAGVSFVTPDATDTSPQYIEAPVLSEVSISDPSTMPIANYIFNRVLNTGNATNNLNQFVLANINEDDLAVDGGAPSMAPTGVVFGPTNTVVRATFPMGTISSGDTLGFRADFTGMDNLPDARDFVGYSLVTISDNAANAIELAATASTFTAGAAPGGTATLQVCFNQAVSDAGTADAYDILLNGVALRAGGQVSFGVPAIDADDPSKVNISVDTNNAGTDDIGVAGNGRAIDGNVGFDFDGVGVADHSQLGFFLQLRDDGGTDPADALGNSLDLGGTPFEDTNAAGDAIAPAFQFAATQDTDGDGNIDGVALVFDATVAGASINGVTIEALDGSMVTDLSMIEAGTGVLPADVAIDLMGDQTIPATFTATLGTIEINGGQDNEAFETNNAVIFGGLDLMTFADNMQPVPSSGNVDNFRITYNDQLGTITDADGNAYEPGMADMQDVDTDRAAPALLRAYRFTGDNQGASNDQLATEQDGNVGDQLDNDRILMAFSEDLNDNTPDVSAITIDGDTFDTNNDNDGRLAGATADNMLTVENDDSIEFGAGNTVALDGGIDMDDPAGNTVVGSQALMDGVAPYIPLQNDGGVIDSAFLVDDDNDGFADRIFLQFTEDVVQANIASDGSDFQSFGANAGTITGADTLTGTDNSIIVLTVVDGEITMNAASDLRYLGTTAAMLIESAATGNMVTDADVAFQAQEINDPTVFTNSPDIMLIVGTLTGPDGVTPAPIGTRVYASIAVPSIDSINADHNGVAFAYRYDDREYGSVARNSLDAFNNVFLGLRSFLYLHRESDNEQAFSNTKINDDDGDGGGADAGGFIFDTIDVALNTRNLSSISFTGTGETSQDRVRGTATLAWRLLRGGSTPQSLYSNGFEGDFGSIMFSQAVISEAGGRYELKVSGIGGGFVGSPIAALDLPVIIWCQLPTGERYALSSLVTSASTNDFDGDGVVGNGIIFAPNNLTQDADGTASDATNINFNLANVGVAHIFRSWTMVPFGRAGGFANSSRDIPTLPNGVAEGNIVAGSVLAVSPIDQFVFFEDGNEDGIWDSNDGGLSDLFVDFDTMDHMRFSLTTNGIEMGSGMTQAVGGYGIGILNLSGNTYGAFQFGAPIAAGPIFAANPVTGSVANATEGWLLVSTSAESMPATNFFTQNPGSDFIIFFNNMGSDGITADSLSVTPGDANPNDLDELPAWSAPFVHFVN